MKNQTSGRAEYTLVWTIENFKCAWHKKGEKLDSPQFVTDILNKTSWTLELYPRGVENENYISCCIRRHSMNFDADCEFDYELLVSQCGGSTQRVCGNNKMNGFPLLLKREENDHEKNCDHQGHLTLQCRIFLSSDVGYNIEGEFFGKTHLLVEQITYSYCFKSDVVYKNIMVQRVNDFQKLLIIRLIQLQENDLSIDLFPCTGCTGMKYYDYRLTVEDKETSAKLCDRSSEGWGSIMNATINVSLAVLEQSETRSQHSLRLNFEVIFSTGEVVKYRGRTSLRYVSKVPSAVCRDVTVTSVIEE